MTSTASTTSTTLAGFEVSNLTSQLPPAHDATQTSALPQSVDDRRWTRVLARDAAESFVYAVVTTGIYCRPSCPSRRPLRPNVRFFATGQAAASVGFRACMRCRPDAQPAEAALVERLAAFLDRERDRSVSLAELGRVGGCAPSTVQRVFTRVMGLSPRAWANARRAEAYRELLATPASPRLTDAVYDAGFSSPSRAHHAAPVGMEARRYRAQGAGETIGYTTAEATLAAGGHGQARTLGRILVAATARGLCAVLLGEDDAELVAELRGRFPRAGLAAQPGLNDQLAAVLAHLTEHPGARALPLDLRGTAFQARVWAALRTIPRGETRSYSQLAAAAGAPGSVRAVAAACGQNPAAIVVPCHRVIAADGKLTGYRWGLDRKRALLAHEGVG